MPVWAWSLILFIVGTIEYFLSEYQTLVSVRLKVGKTVAFAYVNHVIDFIVHIFLFGLIFDFWNKLEKGTFDYHKLIPYAFYIHGCIAGTALALVVYKYHKKAEDRKRNLAQLERARHKRKILRDIQADVTVEVDEDIDEEIKESESNVEIEAGNIPQEVYNQTDGQGIGTTTEEPTGSPPQSGGQSSEGNP